MIRSVQNISSLIAGIAASIFLLIVLGQTIWWVILILTIIWLGLLVSAERFIQQKNSPAYPTILLTIFSTLGFLGLLALTEIEMIKLILVVLSGMSTAFLIHTSLPAGASVQAFEAKRTRRILMILWVFSVYAILATLFATTFFFQSIPFFLVAVVGAAMFSLGTRMIWRLYEETKAPHTRLWILVFAVCMMELLWAIHLLPFGYLVSAWMATWVWYIAQLLIRFHLSRQGIDWARQRWFLAGNIILYFLFLLSFVRWV